VISKVVHQDFIVFGWHEATLLVFRGARLLELEAALCDACGAGAGAGLGYCGVDAEVLSGTESQVFELFYSRFVLICSLGWL